MGDGIALIEKVGENSFIRHCYRQRSPQPSNLASGCVRMFPRVHPVKPEQDIHLERDGAQNHCYVSVASQCLRSANFFKHDDVQVSPLAKAERVSFLRRKSKTSIPTYILSRPLIFPIFTACSVWVHERHTIGIPRRTPLLPDRPLGHWFQILPLGCGFGS